MSKLIAITLAFTSLSPTTAMAATDPTNDPGRERQVYLVMLDRYLGRQAVCVLQKPDDFPHFINRHGRFRQGADWRYFDADQAEHRAIDRDFSTLEYTQRAPVVGHYIPPELLPVNMRLVAPGDACSPTLKLSAPAFVGQTAFIDLTYDCVLCGIGATYALRIRDGQWQVAAEWVHWVS